MERGRYSSIRKIILISMIIVPAIPFFLSLGIGYYYFVSSLENNVVSKIKGVVEYHRLIIENFLEERKADLELISSSYTFEEFCLQENLEKIFHDLQRGSNAYVDLGIFDQEGLHVAYYGPYELKGRLYREADWFKEVMRRGWYISDVFLGYRRIPHFIIAIANKNANRTWVVRATIDTHMFNELVEKVRIGKTGEAYILNGQGVFQTTRRSGGDLMEKDSGIQIEPSAQDSPVRTFIKEDSRGDAYLYATAWLRNKAWLLVARQEKSEAFRSLYSATYLIILISVIGGGVIILLAFFLTNRIVRRMEHLDAEKDGLSQQLVRATGLAELGQMAAGFAHEINNPLQIIRNEYFLIKDILSELKEKGEIRDSRALDEVEDSLNQVNIQMERCAKITRSILKFGRRDAQESRMIDLRDFIPEVTSMVEKKAQVEGIALSLEIAEEIPRINADHSQLQQVLINLLNNAIDATLAKHGQKGGQIIVGARLKDGERIEIYVKDNGCGISPENQGKVFMPFFTTKPVGKGSGLGLSVCYGIVKDMGGVMEFSSEEGVGTTFYIYLPAPSKGG
ncbi:MAG: two-component sensor histidine kinase [Deltaproteobacteria bacterium]|nr:two-component sensor histidine kinase [Deltaproteobacteria bacterium]MBW2064814.1 two-component sensor histidine kinase [Deltaproteobacteria bacterium]